MSKGEAVRTFLHVPTPGDHYSAATGSAVMTVIYELNRRHQRQGGASQLIVGRGTRHDYPVGECIEVAFPPLPDRNRKIADALLGRIGMARPFIGQTYRPAAEAISPDFTGVVFAHNAPGALRGFRARASGARIGLYCHNSLFGTYSSAETRRALAAADLVICVSKFIAEELKAHLGKADGRVYGINNGVDTERFRPAEKALETEEPVILFVGRVTPEKGPDLLLQAAQKIADGKRRFKIRIVGSNNFNANDPLTSYEQELRRLAEPIQRHVEFQPFVDRARILEEYHAASVFCAPSNWDEPCSLTVPEAIACGLPTITSHRGGIPEVGGDAVLYFNPPDVAKLAEHLAYLIDDPKARTEWGARARVRAEAICWENQYRLVYAAVEA